MTMSKDLFLAILSMDAYNRGYGAGTGGEQNGLGDAIGTRIGSASISSRSDSDPDSSEAAAGFYALAYEMEADVGVGSDRLVAGQTVISYHGTNAASATEIWQDIWFGWTVGAGVSSASQAGMAIEFYEAVAGKSIYDGAAADTILTGHSLGGGLGGLVSALSTTEGVGFGLQPL